MNKRDELLKPGRLVIFSNGSKGIVMPHKYRKNSLLEMAIVYDFGGYDLIERWHSNTLSDCGFTERRLDILKVYDVGCAYEFGKLVYWNENERSLVWDRNLEASTAKVMTLEEIEKALGHKVKIVLGKDAVDTATGMVAPLKPSALGDWKREYETQWIKDSIPKEEDDLPFGSTKNEYGYNSMAKGNATWAKVTDWGSNAAIYTKSDGSETVKSKIESCKPLHGRFDF